MKVEALRSIRHGRLGRVGTLGRGSLALVTLLALAGSARADTIRLKTGGTLENVKAQLEGDNVRVLVDHGSIVVAKSDVLSIESCPTRAEKAQAAREELAQRKLAAGDDPARIRDAARWAREQGLADESDQLGALARGIELDGKVAALAGSKTAAPFLVLARSLGPEYTPSERASVLRAALAIDPENLSVRAALGEVKRGSAWVTRAEAARLDAEAQAREMTARGFVLFEGQWVTPAAREATLDLRAAQAEQALRDAEQARIDEQARQQQLAAEQAAAQAQAQAQAASDPCAPTSDPYAYGYPYGYDSYGYPYSYYGTGGIVVVRHVHDHDHDRDADRDRDHGARERWERERWERQQPASRASCATPRSQPIVTPRSSVTVAPAARSQPTFSHVSSPQPIHVSAPIAPSGPTSFRH